MIAFENVCKRFGEHIVLENFSFSLGAGEQLCLVGPSGRGKSTVLNLAAGLMEPDAGRILARPGEFTQRAHCWSRCREAGPARRGRKPAAAHL